MKYPKDASSFLWLVLCSFECFLMPRSRFGPEIDVVSIRCLIFRSYIYDVKERMPLFSKCLEYVEYLSIIGISSCFACCARDGARLSAAILRLVFSDNVPASKVRSVTSYGGRSSCPSALASF